jgi:type I restriction enzyme S subunit
MTFQPLVLGDSLELLIDNRGKNPPFGAGGVPIVSGMAVRVGSLDLTDAKTASIDTWKQWMPTPTQPNDVVLTSEAPLGRVALIRTTDPIVIAQRVFCLRGRKGTLDSRYLYYALQSQTVQADLASRATGTTVLGIRQPELLKVRIPSPPFPEQESIAEVLGALDDKIAANDRIVKLGVDLSDSLFVQEIVSAPGGQSTYDEVAVIGGGGTPKTAVGEFWGGAVPWATPTDVTSLSGPYLEKTARLLTAGGLSACSSPLYPVGSILMTSRATIGAFAIAQHPVAVNQGFIVVNAKDPKMQWWLFHDMRSRRNEFLSYANGATFLELSRGKFKKLPVQLPSPEQASSFGAAAAALHQGCANVQRESDRLARARDELLPLLMSGKVRVKDAEAVVSDVV